MEIQNSWNDYKTILVLMWLSLLIQPKSAGRRQSLKAHTNTKQLFWPHSAVHENCYSFYLFIKKRNISL